MYSFPIYSLLRNKDLVEVHDSLRNSYVFVPGKIWGSKWQSRYCRFYLHGSGIDSLKTAADPGVVPRGNHRN